VQKVSLHGVCHVAYMDVHKTIVYTECIEPYHGRRKQKKKMWVGHPSDFF